MGRVSRWMPAVAILALFGFAVAVAVAGVGMASAEGGEAGPDQAMPYRAGPLEARPLVSSLAWSGRTDAILALGVIAGILGGLRASGLARRGRSHRSMPPRKSSETPRGHPMS